MTGAVTFDHYMNASKIVLPNNNNVFIMTDDPQWLKNEIEHRKRNRMNIFSLPPRPELERGSYNASVDFWASITIARQVVYYDMIFLTTNYDTILIQQLFSLSLSHIYNNFISAMASSVT